MQPAGTLALQQADLAWLRAGETMVLTRNVTDESGRSAGLLGAIFRLDDIRRLVRPAWIAPSVATALLAQDGTTLLRTDPSPAPLPDAPAGALFPADLLPRLMLAIDRLTGRPATLAATAEVHSIRATVQTSLAAEAALSAAWSDPSAATPGLLLAGGLALCALLMVIPAGRRRGAAVAAGEPAEAELVVLRERLAAAASDRDRVLAAVGHDVRTPMNSILGICALLVEEGHLAPDQHVWIGRIEASCEALLAMLNGLLEIASGAGNAELRPAEVDVAALVDEVAGVLAPQAHDKGLQIVTRFDDAVHGVWMVDPTRLRQVLFNLASNAIKYTSAGSVELRASAVTDADGRASVRLAVSDTGCGIAREDRGRIFERFMRGGGADAAGGREGLGLGLALCRENAALMGGSLTLDSTVGVGSEFTFEFPAERPGPDRHAAPYSGRTALVVGFDAAQASRLASHLARIGLAVETAEDGFVAIGLAERMASRCGALDAVVVHADMTGLSADAFFSRLRSTAYGHRSSIVAVGTPVSGAPMADAILPGNADGRQVATTVATFRRRAKNYHYQFVFARNAGHTDRAVPQPFEVVGRVCCFARCGRRSWQRRLVVIVFRGEHLRHVLVGDDPAHDVVHGVGTVIVLVTDFEPEANGLGGAAGDQRFSCTMCCASLVIVLTYSGTYVTSNGRTMTRLRTARGDSMKR